MGLAQCIDSAEQRVHARDEVREAQVFRQKIVRAQPQSRHGIELAVARGEKNDGQLRRQRPQLPAQLETAFGLLLERDVDDGEIGQARCESGHGLFAVAVGAYDIALAREGRRVVVADRGLVFDNGNLAFHGL